jgi:hypothetical protein
VAILLARDLNFEVIDGHEDSDQNIIALKIKINGNLYILASIYGPNGSCPVFFKNLDTYLNALMCNSGS